MNTILGKEESCEIINVGLKPGDFLLEAIIKIIETYSIDNGVILSGIGTLDICKLHHIKDDKFPCTNTYYTLNKALELTAVSGMIANSQPHVHIVVTHDKNETYSGHLEKGSRILYLGELSILKFNSIKMKRVMDKKAKVEILENL